MPVSVIIVLIVLAVLAAGFIGFNIFLAIPLNYKDRKRWAIIEDFGSKKCDCFLIYPTVDMGKKGNTVSRMNDPIYLKKAMGTLNQMRGLYDRTCNIYSPFYRQMTFRVFKDTPNLLIKYMNLAYIDVKAAFRQFLKQRDPETPFIIAGFSQGSFMALCLCRDFLSDEKLRSKFVAAYCPGWMLYRDDVKDHPYVFPALEEDDIGCVISFNSEAEGVTIAEDGERVFSINPLNWRTDSALADKSLNKGAVFFDTYGNFVKKVPHFCSAYKDPVSGRIKIPDVDIAEYPGKIFKNGIFHIYDYMFFFNNIKENVRVRINAYYKNNAASKTEKK